MSQRILIGNFPDGGRGIRVAEAGYDVMSNPVENARLVFNSDWPSTVKAHQMGQFQLSGIIANNTVTVSFPDLGYVPFCMFGIRWNGVRSGNYVPSFDSSMWYSQFMLGEGEPNYGSGGAMAIPHNAGASETAVNIRATSNSIIGRYQLYRNPAAEYFGFTSTILVNYLVTTLRVR